MTNFERLGGNLHKPTEDKIYRKKGGVRGTLVHPKWRFIAVFELPKIWKYSTEVMKIWKLSEFRLCTIWRCRRIWKNKFSYNIIDIFSIIWYTWNSARLWTAKLKRYVCVCAPDFSPMPDMPWAVQVFNHYRKHRVARWLQENGVTVIPTVRASADEKSFRYCFDGEP